MKISLISYATIEYDKKMKMNALSAKYFGKFDKVYSYSPEDIDDDFKSKNSNILSKKRGAGLWLWKPYFFYKVLNEEIVEEEFLFYCDASSFFIRSIKPLIKHMKISNKDIMCFSLPLLEKEWTSKKVLEYFKASDDVINSNQILANFLIVKKTKKTLAFAKEWLELCKNKELMLFDSKKKIRATSDFKDHRFDQSILSLLCKKNNIDPFRDPSQFGFFPEMYRNNGTVINLKHTHSPYGTIIILLRKSTFLNEYFRFILKSVLKFLFPSLYNTIIK
jgi:hypothetical protein